MLQKLLMWETSGHEYYEGLKCVRNLTMNIAKALNAFDEIYNTMHYKSCRKYYKGFTSVRNLATNITKASSLDEVHLDMVRGLI